MNGLYIRDLSLEDFVQQELPFLDRDLHGEVRWPLSTEYMKQIMSLIQERAGTLGEVAELAQYFFTDELVYDPALLISKNMSGESVV